MRIDRRLVGFGVFLLAAGVAMLAVRQGLISDDMARRAWSLWPLILIGFGLSIVLAGRPGAAIGSLVAALTLGTILGLAIGSGTFVPGLCTGRDDATRPFGAATGDLAASARVTIEQDCGGLHVTSVAGSKWTVGGSTPDARPPTITASATDLRIASPDRSPFDLAGNGSWEVALPRDPSIDLDVQANAGDARLDLGGARLTRLSVQRNAGSIRIDLRDVAAIATLDLAVNAGSATLWLPGRSVKGSVHVNAGSLALCIPAGAGLRVDVGSSVAASNDFAPHGLVQTGTTWETPGFATNEVQLDLSADANAASLSLDPTDGCAA